MVQTDTISQLPLARELHWLQQVVQTRLQFFTDARSENKGKAYLPPPALESAEPNPYARFALQAGLTAQERFLLMLAFAPHIKPGLLDQLFANYLKEEGAYPEIGGVRNGQSRNFIPTGETALFLLAGPHLDRRLESELYLSTESRLFKEQLLYLEEVKEGEPRLSGRLLLHPEYVELFKSGRIMRPVLSSQFPAQYIETSLDWDDLVLPKQTRQQVAELQRWVRHHQTLMQEWGMGGKLRPGYRALFHGPPGTGKTLTATLLGKATGKDVFRVDLSMVVSKYIGETEKNLSRLFDRAERKDWILFFDEADALFGKRTDIRDAHDKYANQEVSYLLQRIEGFDGLTILASNFKNNLDDAFTRRFQSIVFFPMPKASERLLLWQKAFPQQLDISSLDLDALAERFELSGANIMNIVQFLSLQMIDLDIKEVPLALLEQAIYREYSKEGKLI
ncbi:MAG: ATP-binding protein [Bacteroidota bacterium]